MQEEQALPRPSYEELEARVKALESRVRESVCFEAEREKLKTQMAESARYGAMGSFARGIVHEINNVLGIIMAFVERGVAANPPGTGGNANYSRLLDAVNRARDLVRQIPASYRKADAKSSVEIGLIVKGAAKFLEGSLPINVNLSLDIPAGLGSVKADPAEVHRILVYLGSIASLALERTGGELSISLSRAQREGGAAVRLSAVCRRAAKSPDAPDLALLADSTSNRYAGFIEDIMAEHGGTSAISATDEEIGFVMDFPMDIGEVEQPKADSQQGLPQGSEKLLFVEDEVVLADLWKEVLTDMGYEVTVAHSGREALDIFTADPSKFDCVLTDRTMPIMPGERLARAIYKIRPGIPIIMCTGHSGLMTPEMLEQNRLKACLQKPLGFKEVAETIRRVIDESRQNP